MVIICGNRSIDIPPTRVWGGKGNVAPMFVRHISTPPVQQKGAPSSRRGTALGQHHTARALSQLQLLMGKDCTSTGCVQLHEYLMPRLAPPFTACPYVCSSGALPPFRVVFVAVPFVQNVSGTHFGGRSNADAGAAVTGASQCAGSSFTSVFQVECDSLFPSIGQWVGA